MNDGSGFIYIYGGSGMYKIGKTKNVKVRVRSFLTLPFKASLIHTIEATDARAAELHYHERYKDKRTNGEWFNLSDEDIEALKQEIVYDEPHANKEHGVKFVTIPIETDLWKAIEKQAERERRSIKSQIKWMCRQYLNNHQAVPISQVETVMREMDEVDEVNEEMIKQVVAALRGAQ